MSKTRPDLTYAQLLLDKGMKLCELENNSKRPRGNKWNKRWVNEINPDATGYGFPLAENGRVSVDPDNKELSKVALKALGLDPKEVMTTGVRTLSSRPGSGGRCQYRDPGGLRWIKFSTKEHGTILELRATSPNLQDVVPGLVYADKTGELRHQQYANGKTFIDAVDMPESLLKVWRRLSEDVEFLREMQSKVAEAVGGTAHLAVSAGSELGFRPSIGGLREWFNEGHSVEDLLIEHGYEGSDGRYAPPTATGAPGVRAIAGKDDLWQSDHASDPLWGTFDAWSAFVALEHEGDLEAAEAAVRDAFVEARDKEILEQFEDLGEADDDNQVQPVNPKIPSRESLVPSLEDMQHAELTPTCIVENYLYADVAQLIAPGGVGKTTTALYEMACIALGRDLWGNKVVTPGWSLLVTAEDSKGLLLARLWRVMEGMDLSPAEIDRVRRSVLIWDLSGHPKKLAMVHDGNVVPTTIAGEIVEAFAGDPPVMVVFDPLVSFGASESMVNDNEQALVHAARRIVKGLNCCVRYVHHTGKANAREQTLDQYSGRNGSALPDGARMNSVLATWKKGSKLKWDGEELQPPPALTADEGPNTRYFVINRAKLSYAPPNLPLIWVRRDGFRYTWVLQTASIKEVKLQDLQRRVLEFLASEILEERYHTVNSLGGCTDELDAGRDKIRGAVKALKKAGALVESPLPDGEKQGRKQYYLEPTEGAPESAH